MRFQNYSQAFEILSNGPFQLAHMYPGDDSGSMCIERTRRYENYSFLVVKVKYFKWKLHL